MAITRPDHFQERAVTNPLLLLYSFALQIGADLSYSERILRYMRLCCCVGFFCSCCTEPERNKKDARWREQAERDQRRKEQQQQQRRQQGGGGGQPGGRGQRDVQMQQQQQQASYAGVNTQGLDEDDRQVRGGGCLVVGVAGGGGAGGCSGAFSLFLSTPRTTQQVRGEGCGGVRDWRDGGWRGGRGYG